MAVLASQCCEANSAATSQATGILHFCKITCVTSVQSASTGGLGLFLDPFGRPLFAGVVLVSGGDEFAVVGLARVAAIFFGVFFVVVVAVFFAVDLTAILVDAVAVVFAAFFAVVVAVFLAANFVVPTVAFLAGFFAVPTVVLVRFLGARLR